MMTRRMVAVAVLALAAAGCSSADKGGGDVAPAPAVAATHVDERPADCGPARDVIPGPCTMRATADPSVWTIHDASGRQIGVASG